MIALWGVLLHQVQRAPPKNPLSTQNAPDNFHDANIPHTLFGKSQVGGIADFRVCDSSPRQRRNRTHGVSSQQAHLTRATTVEQREICFLPCLLNSKPRTV